MTPEEHTAMVYEARRRIAQAKALMWMLAAVATFAAFFALTGCASQLAQGEIAVKASKDMLRAECPQYVTSLYPERVKSCETRLILQQASEAAYNSWLAADAIGRNPEGYKQKFLALIGELLP